MGNVGTDNRWGRSRAGSATLGWTLDPLSDQPGKRVTLDQVSIVRIACVAAETGARLQREGLAVDPIKWMTTPLSMFSDRPPIEACMDKDHCARAFLLHGLGLDLDCDPAVLDELILVNELEHEETACD